MFASPFVQVVPCDARHYPVPMIAFAPDYGIGVTPVGRGQPGITWFHTTRDGVPLFTREEPDADECPYLDLLVWQLSLAYAALIIAQQPGQPTWRA